MVSLRPAEIFLLLLLKFCIVNKEKNNKKFCLFYVWYWIIDKFLLLKNLNTQFEIKETAKNLFLIFKFLLNYKKKLIKSFLRATVENLIELEVSSCDGLSVN